MIKYGGKKNCISVGTCNKKYCYIILGQIIALLLVIILMVVFYIYLTNNNYEKKIKIDLMLYLFYANFGEALMIIPDLLLKKTISSVNTNLDFIQKMNNIKKYIFKNNSKEFSTKDKIYFTIFAFLKLCLDITLMVYLLYFNNDSDNIFNIVLIIDFLVYAFNFELIFLFLLSKIMYGIQYYRHQHVSIIVLAVIALVNLIVKNMNKGISNLFFNFIYHLIYSFFKSLMAVYIKGLMEYKYISPYKACYRFGMTNLAIVTIVYIIVTFFPCDKDVCQTNYDGKRYFGNILLLFTIPGLFVLILLILKAVILIFNYITIHDFSVCHSFLLIHISQFLGFGAFINNNSGIYSYQLLCFGIGFFLSILFILVFLEIIEINRCGMNYNTKKNIEIRAIEDMEYSDLNINNDNEEKQEDDDDKNPKIEIFKIYV